MAREPFRLELIGVTSQDYDLEVTVTGFPTTGDLYSAIVSQQPQWYEDPVYGTVFRVDDGMGYSYWRAIHNDMAISDKLQELIDIKQDIKVAIENKGVDMTGVDFGGYAGKIDSLSDPLPDPLITVHGFFALRPSGSTPGKVSWNIPSALLDKLYCYSYSNGSHEFYKLSDMYLMSQNAGTTTYASRLNTATGSVTKNVSTNGYNIGFNQTSKGSPGEVGLLCIIPPDESLTQYSSVSFTANNGAIVDMVVKKCEIPKSLLDQYYPGFNESMIKRFYISDGAILLSNRDGW